MELALVEHHVKQALAASLCVAALCFLCLWTFAAIPNPPGDAEFVVAAEPTVIIAATERALEQLHWTKWSATASHGKACLEGETGTGAPLVVLLNAASLSTDCDVRLQVGTSWANNIAECNLLRYTIQKMLKNKSMRTSCAGYGLRNAG